MYAQTKLTNGLRVVTESVPFAQSVALGIWLDVGARDEQDREAGISHLAEHMLFKGTGRRTAQQIAEELDAVGGQLNAFTDKEYTCYYAKVLPEHVSIAVDVLADMLQNSLLDPEELERERNVVLEEIKRHEDSPEDLVHDVFAGVLWPGHPLGRPVIGRPESVQRFTRGDLVQYLARHYRPDRLVVAAAGKLTHEEIIALVERHFGGLTGQSSPRTSQRPDFGFGEVILSKNTEQVHFCFGTRGFDENDEDRYALGILDTAIGGGMSSRLFQEVREKRGLCYSIGSYVASYREAGMFAIYAGTSLTHLDEVRELARQELVSVAKKGLTGDEFQRAKNQIRGGVLLGLDSMTGRMSRLGKSILHYDRVVSPFEIVEKVESLTQNDVQRVAQLVFGDESFAYAAVGPFNASQ
ncbi:MAG: insulinase family protein [Armatimonadetes bacterium]|nr:insulinase family protein [Armatimonadota bacterium]